MLEVKMGLEFTFQRWLASGARVSYHSPGIAVRGMHPLWAKVHVRMASYTVASQAVVQV